MTVEQLVGATETTSAVDRADTVDPVDACSTPDALAVLLAQYGRATDVRIRSELGATGLKPRHGLVLRQLADNGPMSQQALIEALGVDPSVLVSILNDLESHGFAERRRDPDDRRRHIVEMSRRGAAALTRVDEVMSTVEREVFGDLSQDERDQLRKLLGRLRTSPDVQVCAGD